MAILASEIDVMHSTNRLGGAITANESNSGVSGNLFDTFSGAETSAGGTFYACVYVQNNTVDTGAIAQAMTVHVESETSAAGINLSIGLGTSAVNGVEQTIADENTAPVGVTFSEADGVGNALTIGDVPDGEHKAIWIRCVIDPATAAVSNYQFQLRFNFDTAA